MTRKAAPIAVSDKDGISIVPVGVDGGVEGQRPRVTPVGRARSGGGIWAYRYMRPLSRASKGRQGPGVGSVGTLKTIAR